MKPFCCNPKCQHNKVKVADDIELINLVNLKAAKMPMGPGNQPYKVDIPSYILPRHQIHCFSDGLEIDDYLCDVCYEVFKMVDGQ